MSVRKKLIILPGWGGSHTTWQKFIELAEKEFVTSCIDLPCFGDTPCPDTVWGIEEYAAFVRNKIQNSGSKVILLGHSFGGQVATHLAAKNPELFERLILSGAAIIRPNQLFRRAIFEVIAKAGAAVFKLPILEKFSKEARAILYRSANSPDYSKTSGIKREIYKKIIRQDLTGLLHSIQIPTLIVWGERDKMTPLSQGKKIASLIPEAKFAIFPNCGHGIHIQSPNLLLKEVQNFCK